MGQRSRISDTYRTHELDAYQSTHIDAVKEYASLLETCILVRMNTSREKALALTKLEECVMWATKGIAKEARNEQDS